MKQIYSMSKLLLVSQIQVTLLEKVSYLNSHLTSIKLPFFILNYMILFLQKVKEEDKVVYESVAIRR